MVLNAILLRYLFGTKIFRLTLSSLSFLPRKNTKPSFITYKDKDDDVL